MGSNRLLSATVIIGLLTGTGSSLAQPALRYQVDQNGDFVLFGNTMGYECDVLTGWDPTTPVVGTPDCTGVETNDESAPDILWRCDSPDDGDAEANGSITPDQARSTAVLDVPDGATINFARMYWAGYLPANTSDSDVLVEGPGVSPDTVTADDAVIVADANTGRYWYQSTADVTSLVVAAGEGPYRVSGVDTLDLTADTGDPANDNPNHAIAAWYMVVFYELDGDPSRNLSLFDGLEFTNSSNPQNVEITGFLVPNSGYDAKLGVVTFEGEAEHNGDSFSFNGTPLENALNPVDNFFNASRTYLGSAVSLTGDLPQLSGEPRSMAGIDMDVLDVRSLVSSGDTSATIEATSTLESFLLASFVTSISTFAPNFVASGKTLEDLNADLIAPGDVLEYTVTVVNTGNDRSIDTVLTDPLPSGVTYVDDSIVIVSGTNAGALTDGSGDDQGEYDADSRTITVRLGTGADEVDGGVMDIDESAVIRFQVTVDDDAAGTIANQANITAGGELGAPPDDYFTDEDEDAAGPQPTLGEVGSCAGPHCVDTDGDGILDPVEVITFGTDPNDADSDDDGVPDGDEPSLGEDSDGDGLINALDPDSDNDGLFDGTELGLDCSSSDTDTDAGACRADADSGATTTDPLDADTDDGGVDDGNEDFNLDGAIDAGETDPTAGHGDDDDLVDSDGDGLGDTLEEELGSDPNDADSDDDGVPDGDEPNWSADTDGDNLINVLDPDSDGDGLLDGTELGLGCTDSDTDVSAGNCVPDGDDGDTTTNPLDADTDGGGVEDGVEDANGNGVVDTGETDPNDASDDVPPTCTDDSDCGASDSGRVCNADGECQDGCRGSGGNGCPTGESCTSTDTTIGECVVEGSGGAGGGPGTGGSAGAAGSVTAGGAAGAPSGGAPATAGAAGSVATAGGAGAPSGAGAPGTGGATAEGGAGEEEEAPEGVLEGGGCSCSVPGGASRNLTGWALALVVGLLWRSRRKR